MESVYKFWNHTKYVQGDILLSIVLHLVEGTIS